MISDLYFSHHNLEVLCSCYRYIECRSGYILGRADERHILEQRDACLCLVVTVYWVLTSLKTWKRSVGEPGETKSGMSLSRA